MILNSKTFTLDEFRSYIKNNIRIASYNLLFLNYASPLELITLFRANLVERYFLDNPSISDILLYIEEGKFKRKYWVETNWRAN